MKKAKELMERIVVLAKKPETDFLELGETLRQLHDLAAGLGIKGGAPNTMFWDALAKAHIGRRKGQYLVLISRLFGGQNIPPARLRKIGWSKLAALTPIAEERDMEELLSLAEQHTVDELRGIVTEGPPRRHYVGLRLTDEEIGVVYGALMTNGSFMLPGGGLAYKEQALLRMIKRLYRAVKEGFIP